MIRETIPADELLSKAHSIGQYYGFTPLSLMTSKSRGEMRKHSGYPESLNLPALDPVALIVANFLKRLRNIDCAPTPRQPLFLWHSNIAAGRPAPKKAVIQFHALGTDRALADVVIIRALVALTRELFHEEPVVRINSMGDKETRARYSRELGTFFKKQASVLPEECINCAKQDTLLAAELAIANEHAEDLPAPTEQLSDASRKRFEDLLEYLELTDTSYELTKNLISRGNAWNDTCFEISAGGRGVVWGSRYADLTRHFFPSAPMSATCGVLQIASTGTIVEKAAPTSPRISFVHIGDEAKRLAIRLAEEFRKARVSLSQDIGVESLTEQLTLAERRRSPYLLIMGRKEALDGSAILRNQQTSAETLLPLLGLAERLKTVF